MARQRTYYVYIMASKSRVVYVGVTGFLMARVLRHQAGQGGSSRGGIRCIDSSTLLRFEMWAMRSHARRRSRDGGGRRKWR